MGATRALSHWWTASYHALQQPSSPSSSSSLPTQNSHPVSLPCPLSAVYPPQVQDVMFPGEDEAVVRAGQPEHVGRRHAVRAVDPPPHLLSLNNIIVSLTISHQSPQLTVRFSALQKSQLASDSLTILST